MNTTSDRSGNPAPDPGELEPDQYLPWPWRELNELSDQTRQAIAEGVTRIMQEAGEDPGNEALFTLRCVQVAYGLTREDKYRKG